MQLNASMNNTIAERFNVAGALVVKLFGKHDRERDDFSRAAPGASATSACTTRDVLAGPVRRARARRRRRHRGRLLASAANLAIDGTIGVGTIAAFVGLRRPDLPPLTQLTNARVDVLTALVSFERVFEVLDFPALDRRAARRVRPRRPDGPDRLRPRVVPPPGAAGVVAPVARGAAPAPPTSTPTSRASGSSATSASPSSRVSSSRSSGRRARARPPPRCSCPRIADVNEGAVRVDGHDVRDLTLESLRVVGRHGHAGPAPLPRHDPREPALRQARRHRRRAGRRVQGGAHPRPDREPPRRLRHGRRRARLPHVGRREAAARDRPHAAQGPRGRHPRRGDVAPRLRVRARDPARAGRRARPAARRS